MLTAIDPRRKRGDTILDVLRVYFSKNVAMLDMDILLRDFGEK